MTDSTRCDFLVSLLVVSDLVTGDKQGSIDEVLCFATLAEARAKQAEIAARRDGASRKILIADQISLKSVLF